MNRKEIITKFLKFWAQLAKENPRLVFGTGEHYEMIYGQLKELGVKDTESNRKYDDNHLKSLNDAVGNPVFYKFVKYYYDNPNIRVFCQSSWKYFCQFVTRDDQIKNVGNHIKLYVPLDADHLEDGAKMIFDFIADNKLCSNSKISSEIRFDDIVIRMVEPEELLLLLKFIDNNEYIQEGLMTPNPFAFNYHGLAFACDGLTSYNGIISSLIDLYIGYKQKNNDLENVNANDFYKYVSFLYTSNYIYKSDKTFLKYLNNIDDDSLGNDYFKDILKLVIDVNTDRYTFYDFLGHYKKQCYNELDMDQTIYLLFYSIDTISERYSKDKTINQDNVRNEALLQIHKYLETGNSSYITRARNLRNRLHNSNFRDNLNYLLVSEGKNIFEYVDYLKGDVEATKKIF